MDVLAPVRAFDRFQRAHRPLAFAIAVLKKFSDDQAGGLAALIAYYAFFSLFPLLLVFVTILGFVLQGDSHTYQTVTDSVTKQFPGIGKVILGNAQSHPLHGSATALAIGIAGSLWGGLRVTNAAQNAFNHVWAVPFKDRPDFLQARLRGLAVLVALGVLFLVSSLASGIVTGGLGGPLLKLAGIVLSLGLNFALFSAAFRLMTAAEVATRCLWTGVAIASVLWELLQVVGGYYVGHVLRHASGTYGTFGFVIGLLSWLYLGAQITLYAAEINVVVTRRLWPRRLFEPPAKADEKTLRALAKVQERSDREMIDVRFGRPGEKR